MNMNPPAKLPRNTVLFVINEMAGGGAERVVQTLANHLAEQLHVPVEIWILQDEPIAYELSSKVRIRRSVFAKIRASILPSLTMPLQTIELAIRVPAGTHIVSFLVRANLVMTIVKYFRRHMPLVISERNQSSKNYRKSRFLHRLMRRLITSLYSLADKIIAISFGIKSSLVSEFGLSADQIEVIHNPQPPEVFAGDVTHDHTRITDTGRPRLVTVGRLTPQKDHDTLIRAVRLLSDSGTHVSLDIYGVGAKLGETQALIDELVLGEQVSLKGWHDRPLDTAPPYDAFVLSSRWEGFGNVLVEAMAKGLPVISTDCPSGPAEILGGGKDGMLVPVGDPSALADALGTIVKSEELLRHYSLAAIKRAKAFHVENVAPSYLEVMRLSAVLGKAGRVKEWEND